LRWLENLGTADKTSRIASLEQHESDLEGKLCLREDLRKDRLIIIAAKRETLELKKKCTELQAQCGVSNEL
jgi:hypothetical protein